MEEEVEHPYGYVFQIDFGLTHPRVRRFWDVSEYLPKHVQDQFIADIAAYRLGLSDMPFHMQKADDLVHEIAMSARFSDTGVNYLIKSPVELTCQHLNMLLAMKQARGELEDFLKESKL